MSHAREAIAIATQSFEHFLEKRRCTVGISKMRVTFPRTKRISNLIGVKVVWMQIDYDNIGQRKEPLQVSEGRWA
jgi:hypothetical protein